MTQEITAFGPTCDEINNSLIFSTTQNISTANHNLTSEVGPGGVHFLQVFATWATFFMVIALACIVVRDTIRRNKERADQKRADQMRSTSSSEPVVTEAAMMGNAESDRRKIEDAIDEPNQV